MQIPSIPEDLRQGGCLCCAASAVHDRALQEVQMATEFPTRSRQTRARRSVTLAAALLSSAVAVPAEARQSCSPVLQWNEYALQATVTAAQGPFRRFGVSPSSTRPCTTPSTPFSRPTTPTCPSRRRRQTRRRMERSLPPRTMHSRGCFRRRPWISMASDRRRWPRAVSPTRTPASVQE